MVVESFWNYLGVGQFELARSVLVDSRWEHPEGCRCNQEQESCKRQSTFDLLLSALKSKSIFKAVPGFELVLSPAVPSLAHLEWLLLCLLKDEGRLDQTNYEAHYREKSINVLSSLVLLHAGQPYCSNVFSETSGPSRVQEYLLQLASDVDFCQHFLLAKPVLGFWLLQVFVEYFGNRSIVLNILQAARDSRTAGELIPVFSLFSKYLAFLGDTSRQKTVLSKLFTFSFCSWLRRSDHAGRRDIVQIILRDWVDNPDMLRQLCVLVLPKPTHGGHFLKDRIDNVLDTFEKSNLPDPEQLLGCLGRLRAHPVFRALVTLLCLSIADNDFDTHRILLDEFLGDPSEEKYGGTVQQLLLDECIRRRYRLRLVVWLSNGDRKLSNVLLGLLNARISILKLLSEYPSFSDRLLKAHPGELSKIRPNKHSRSLCGYSYDFLLVDCLRIVLECFRAETFSDRVCESVLQQFVQLEDLRMSIALVTAVLAIVQDKILASSSGSEGLRLVTAMLETLAEDIEKTDDVSLQKPLHSLCVLCLDVRIRYYILSKMMSSCTSLASYQLLNVSPYALVSRCIITGLSDLAMSGTKAFQLGDGVLKACHVAKLFQNVFSSRNIEAPVEDLNELFDSTSVEYQLAILDIAIAGVAREESATLVRSVSIDGDNRLLGDMVSRAKQLLEDCEQMERPGATIRDALRETAISFDAAANLMERAVDPVTMNLEGQTSQTMLLQLDQLIALAKKQKQESDTWDYLEQFSSHIQSVEHLLDLDEQEQKSFITSRRTISMSPGEIIDSHITRFPLETLELALAWGLDAKKVVAICFFRHLQSGTAVNNVLSSLRIAEGALSHGVTWDGSIPPLYSLAKMRLAEANVSPTWFRDAWKTIEWAGDFNNPIERYLSLLQQSDSCVSDETPSSPCDLKMEGFSALRLEYESRVSTGAVPTDQPPSPECLVAHKKSCMRVAKTEEQEQQPCNALRISKPLLFREEILNRYSVSRLIEKGFWPELAQLLVQLMSKAFESLDPIERLFQVQKLRNEFQYKESMYRKQSEHKRADRYAKQIYVLTFVDIW
eukprot:CAMPEP_0203745030 /NCGR_PEP_ID=MMETSP0098-20131031/906_1 /ASSEMBLY_ACC=CAM_ASM_000208 /TAXON_ID=96639 /ORGANISM=" , Strain NY0313808BC1" /LENGTH=1059 /DNA_ID=CAMNT_0050632711 /DNA_START=118 /DNA_END=3294 /DNA_ORIENTATION=+